MEFKLGFQKNLSNSSSFTLVNRSTCRYLGKQMSLLISVPKRQGLSKMTYNLFICYTCLILLIYPIRTLHAWALQIKAKMKDTISLIFRSLVSFKKSFKNSKLPTIIHIIICPIADSMRNIKTSRPDSTCRTYCQEIYL